MCNLDIRKAIKDANVRHWQVAETLGIAETTFCRMLRKELSAEQKRKTMAAIKGLGGMQDE